MTTAAMEYSGVGRALHDLGYGQDASEYHGTLCGMLCVHQEIPEALGLMADYPASVDEEQIAAARTQIDELHAETIGALQDAEMGFSPLLPPDDEELSVRVDALAQWCQGFLLGLASQPALDLNEAAPDLREAVEDLIQISRAQVGSADGEEGGAEDDEASYAELLEYVRAAVQLLFLELNPGAPPGADEYDGATVH